MKIYLSVLGLLMPLLVAIFAQGEYKIEVLQITLGFLAGALHSAFQIKLQGENGTARFLAFMFTLITEALLMFAL